MPGQSDILARGIVREHRPPATFLVELANGHRLFVRVPYKQREKVPGIHPGDEVSLEISPADFSNGVLVFENK
jgi:translation initiation factor IF-1